MQRVMKKIKHLFVKQKKVTEIEVNTAIATMAASNVIFNLFSRSALPQSPASHSLSPSLKTTRVCFTSAYKFSSKGGSSAEKNRGAYDGKVWCTKAKPTVEEDVEDDKPLLDKITGAATEYAEETMENVKSATGGISETAKVYADDAKAKTTEAADTIASKAEEGTTKVEEPETTESDGEEVKETAEKV